MLSIFKLDIRNIYEIQDNNEILVDQIILVAGISLFNWQIWLAIMTAGCGLIWALYQHNKNKKIRQQERASEIADDFADNLMERFALICDTLMDNPDIEKMVKTIVQSKQLKQFTNVEIVKILKNKKCFEQYSNIVHSEDTQKKYQKLLDEKYNEHEQQNFESHFPCMLENTLNHLEAKCINISSEAAGSQFIYNSLHQSFLYVVELLSIYISSINLNNVDKYFTNIISVYNMWNKQKERDIKQLNKTQNKIDYLTKKAEKEITKLLNKKNETV